MSESQGHDHVEETVQQLAELHQEHYRSATPTQKTANRVTAALGRPGSFAVVLLLMVLWMAGNYVAAALGMPPLERFPFPALEVCATIAAVLVALLILTTQRHADELAMRRSQLTLQIAVLSEQKIAKVIELLEEQRRENPLLRSRVDPQADAMATAADPRASLQRIEATHDNL